MDVRGSESVGIQYVYLYVVCSSLPLSTHAGRGPRCAPSGGSGTLPHGACMPIISSPCLHTPIPHPSSLPQLLPPPQEHHAHHQRPPLLLPALQPTNADPNARGADAHQAAHAGWVSGNDDLVGLMYMRIASLTLLSTHTHTRTIALPAFQGAARTPPRPCPRRSAGAGTGFRSSSNAWCTPCRRWPSG